jgi:hypothetical protein
MERILLSEGRTLDVRAGVIADGCSPYRRDVSAPRPAATSGPNAAVKTVRRAGITEDILALSSHASSLAEDATPGAPQPSSDTQRSISRLVAVRTSAARHYLVVNSVTATRFPSGR